MSNLNQFTEPLAAIIQSLEDSVLYGTQIPALHTATFERGTTRYPLPPSAVSVTQVLGRVSNEPVQFQPEIDYIFSGGELVWVNRLIHPDNGSQLEIEYTYREPPSGITDFNPGSVAGTLLRAVAREITQLYAQMNEAYRLAFIDEATGVALDNVVALVGVTRIPAQKAVGTATFLLKQAATQTIIIPVGTIISNSNDRTFATTQAGTIQVELTEFQTSRDGGYTVSTNNQIAEVTGVYPKVEPVETAIRIPIQPYFGKAERTITFTFPPVSNEVRIVYKPKSATVPIQATEAGPGGNVNANTLTLMLTPPEGVDGVTNEVPTYGGQEPESDHALRERTKHALQSAGNATLDAIKFSVLGVEGVQGVEVLDYSVDRAIPLGELRVRFFGGNLNEVRDVVNQTRAAGVIPRVEEVLQVFISGVFYLLPGEQPASSNAESNFVQMVTSSINLQTIGAPLFIRRLNALVYEIPGLAEVAEAKLQYQKPPNLTGPVISDPFLVTGNELVRALAGGLAAIILYRLDAVADRPISAGNYEVDLEIKDAQGRSAVFRFFSLEIQVTAHATLKENPTAPPLRVGSTVKTALFQGSTAKLSISVANDLKGFDPVKHGHTIEFLFDAAAYPGLLSTTRSFDVA
ncbi:MAG TPA: baseplate J/gp47 family protein [Candidatus Angelobacter sp.]|nr:baseplate J/gp47 family protein [Candidatus Angelobacter sp.]